MVLPIVLDEYKRAIAENFDARTDYGRSKSHARLADRLVRLAAPQPDERVLDIATGTGFVAILAAQLVGKRGTVVGVDISAGMLDQAATAILAAGVSNVDLIRADAETFDSAGSFDLIFCCNALPYMTDVPAASSLWHSLLRPGGRLHSTVRAEHSYATWSSASGHRCPTWHPSCCDRPRALARPNAAGPFSLPLSLSDQR